MRRNAALLDHGSPESGRGVRCSARCCPDQL